MNVGEGVFHPPTPPLAPLLCIYNIQICIHIVSAENVTIFDVILA